ncbi:unnamed protein product [Larinioides sclopetarius]|uniref:Uncharacterized protein n=1 Tax=Larinioides sclopetarius TaxID=280406 RepID=A0AAV1YV27_9ARAC
MACEENDKRKCFTYIWKLENLSYWRWNEEDCIKSPCFVVDDLLGTKWKMTLDPSVGDGYNNISLFLEREVDDIDAHNIKIDCELAFLSSDGTVLQAFETKNTTIRNERYIGTGEFVSWNKLFCVKRPLFLLPDTLTARCRIRKSVGEMSKDVQCFARTRIGIEKRSLQWNIENFSSLTVSTKRTYEIKSLDNGKKLMSLELALVYDETVIFKIIPDYSNLRISTFQMSILDASKNILKCFQDKFGYLNSCSWKDFTLLYTKRELFEKKSIYLPNDTLSLLFECTFSLGVVMEETEIAFYDCAYFENKEMSDCCFLDENDLPVPKSILIDDLKSMVNNSCLSDVKLKTKNQIYPAHKFILGARSPVFKAMFSTDMKEKINDSVHIEDLTDDTVLRMLRYIYCVDVNWSGPI